MTDRIFDISAHLAKEFGSEQVAVFNQRAEEAILRLLRQLAIEAAALPHLRIPGSSADDARAGWMLQALTALSAYVIAHEDRNGIPTDIATGIFLTLLQNNIKTALSRPALLESIAKAVTL